MLKFQELFKSLPLDTKLNFSIVDLPISANKQTNFGIKFAVILSHNGQNYEWEMDDKQIGRVFTKSDLKTKQIIWTAKTGDRVNIWKTQGAQNAYYVGEPAGMPAAVNSQVAPPHSYAAPDIDYTTPAATQGLVDEIFGKGNDTVTHDGHRKFSYENTFKKGILETVNAMIASGNLDYKNPAEVYQAIDTAKSLVVDAFKAGIQVAMANQGL